MDKSVSLHGRDYKPIFDVQLGNVTYYDSAGNLEIGTIDDDTQSFTLRASKMQAHLEVHI